MASKLVMVVSAAGCNNQKNFPANIRPQPGRRLGAAADGCSQLRSAMPICRVRKEEAERRSTEIYEPSSWTYDYIQSLKLNHAGEVDTEKIMRALEEDVMSQITRYEDGCELEQLSKLVLIDDVQKLGLGKHFEMVISVALDNLLCPQSFVQQEHDIYSTALHFRLLRQSDREASQYMFKPYMDHNGGFKASLRDDVKGMLALYEASHFAKDGEEILVKAREFSTLNLRNHLKGIMLDKNLAAQVSHALELPSHCRLQRLEVRRHIEEQYRRKNRKDMALIEAARLNYNMTQSVLQSDLQDTSRWWEETGLATQLSFARDRLTECFFWAAGLVPEPESRECRKELTKLAVLITIIDDVYDVHGTVDELELFTQAVKRWDINCTSDLPHSMKLCFLALYNTINQMACSILKDKGVNVEPQLAETWADMCSAFLVEARWCHGKHIPSFDEYMSNGWMSVSGPLLLTHAYYLSQPITSKAPESFLDGFYQDFMRWPSMVFRLSNDLATYQAEMARGESASSVTCYMKDTGATEAIACAHMKDLIQKCWQKMNCFKSQNMPQAKSFVKLGMNLGRVSQCVYQYGDGHGAPDTRSKSRVMSLLINPIQPPS
uniref:Uncharacterized protein n=1 Tax=Kalanchoe fedtschenkoi TaxID=63787 RepID=A0A7N0RI97_KALFE